MTATSGLPYRLSLLELHLVDVLFLSIEFGIWQYGPVIQIPIVNHYDARVIAKKTAAYYREVLGWGHGRGSKNL